jgi:hypothetical protein
VFENRVLRRVFGPKRDEVTGEWRKLHNEDLNDLYSLPNTLPPSCAVVMKSGNLNFLEPSGPLQACNGTALPFTPYPI